MEGGGGCPLSQTPRFSSSSLPVYCEVSSFFLHTLLSPCYGVSLWASNKQNQGLQTEQSDTESSRKPCKPLSLHYALCSVTVLRKWTNACPKFRSRDNVLGYALSSCWLLGWSPLTQRVDCPSQCTDTHTDHLLKHCCIYFPDIPWLHQQMFALRSQLCLPTILTSIPEISVTS